MSIIKGKKSRLPLIVSAAFAITLLMAVFSIVACLPVTAEVTNSSGTIYWNYDPEAANKTFTPEWLYTTGQTATPDATPEVSPTVAPDGTGTATPTATVSPTEAATATAAPSPGVEGIVVMAVIGAVAGIALACRKQ